MKESNASKRGKNTPGKKGKGAQRRTPVPEPPVQTGKRFSFKRIGRPILVAAGLIAIGALAYNTMIRSAFEIKKHKVPQTNNQIIKKETPKSPLEHVSYFENALKSERELKDDVYYKIVDSLNIYASKLDSLSQSERFFSSKIAKIYSSIYKEFGSSENFRKFFYSSLSKYFESNNSDSLVKKVFETNSEESLILFANKKDGSISYKIIPNKKKAFFKGIIDELESASAQRMAEISDELYKSHEYKTASIMLSSDIESIQTHIDKIISTSGHAPKNLQELYKLQGLQAIQKLQNLYLPKNFKKTILNWNNLNKNEQSYLFFKLFNNVSFKEQANLHELILQSFKKGEIPMPGHIHINKPRYNESNFIPSPYQEAVKSIYAEYCPAFSTSLTSDAMGSKLVPELVLGITSEKIPNTGGYRAIYNFAVLANGFGMEGKLAYQ